MPYHRSAREFVTPLEVARAADRQFMDLLDQRVIAEQILLKRLPTEIREATERFVPRGPRRQWFEVHALPQQEEPSEAITPASPQDIRSQLRKLDQAYRQLSPLRQEQVAREIYRQACQAEKDEMAASLTVMDRALDNWTPADAAAVRARQAGQETKHRTAATWWKWVEGELALLKANPDGHRLAEAARRAAKAGLADAFTRASAAVRAALDRRALDIAAGLQSQIAQATDRAMLYEVANAGMLAGSLIGTDVLQHLETALEEREAELTAQAAQSAVHGWTQAALAARLAAPDGRCLAETAHRLDETVLTEAFTAESAEARRALRAQAYGLALIWRPRIRVASDATTLEMVFQAARQAGAAIGAETLVVEFLAADLARRRKNLAKEAARRTQAASTKESAPRPARRPLPAPDEAGRLLAELCERNPRVTFNRRCARFHALTRAEQASFVSTVLSLQRQIERCWRANAPVVIRQRGLRVIPASELRPGMRLVGLDWMAKRLERAA